MNKGNVPTEPKPKRKPWSLESRQRMSEYRKAHPQGNRDPAWWDVHPDVKEATLARMREGLRRSQEADG